MYKNFISVGVSSGMITDVGQLVDLECWLVFIEEECKKEELFRFRFSLQDGRVSLRGTSCDWFRCLLIRPVEGRDFFCDVSRGVKDRRLDSSLVHVVLRELLVIFSLFFIRKLGLLGKGPVEVFFRAGFGIIMDGCAGVL